MLIHVFFVQISLSQPMLVITTKQLPGMLKRNHDDYLLNTYKSGKSLFRSPIILKFFLKFSVSLPMVGAIAQEPGLLPTVSAVCSHIIFL